MMAQTCFRLLFILVLVQASLAKDFRGAEYRTIQTYTYGRIETRMQAAPHTGVISSLFTFHEYGSSGIANWNEIDIEFLGRYTDRVQFNTITENQWGHEHSVELDYDPATEFHDYAFEWTPNYVAWFIDGEEVYRQTGTHITELHRASKIMMNLWPSTNASWAGPFYDAWLPIYAFYDRVRYYAYVPGTGNTGTDNNFILLWEDDFDSWDMNRWQKASHTFDSNNCDFIPANAVLQDGYLILCLTQPEATGYHGPALATLETHAIQSPDFQLHQAYPNPFNRGTTLRLDSGISASFSIDIFDLQGNLVYREMVGTRAGHTHEFLWNGSDLGGREVSSGTYLVRVMHDKVSQSQKLLLIK